MNYDVSQIVPHLFVYGTLLSDCKINPYKKYFERNATVFSKAKIKGAIYLVSSYPGLICNDNDDAFVYGELLHFKNPKKSFLILDEYEGYSPDDLSNSEFIRVQKDVISLPNMAVTTAWVYIYNGMVTNLQRIDNGDFLNHMVDQ